MSLARSLPLAFVCSPLAFGCQVDSSEREALPPPRLAFEQQQSTQDEPGGEALLRALEDYEQTNFDEAEFGGLVRLIERDRNLSEKEKIDSFLGYASRRTKGRRRALWPLIEWRAEELGHWMRKNRASLRPKDFQDVFSILSDRAFRLGVVWRDPNIVALACEKAASGEPDTRTKAASLLSDIGTLDEVTALTKRLEVEPDVYTRSFLFVALARYDSEETNKHIRVLLTEYEEPEVLDSVLTLGLVRHHRYDFLPDLRSLRKKLKAVTDVREKGAADLMVMRIDDAIAKLTEQKEKKLPIGLPLDWPATKPEEAE